MESGEAVLDEAVRLFEEKMLPRFRANPDARIGSPLAVPKRKLLQRILCDARLIEPYMALFVLGGEGTRVLAGTCTTREVLQAALGTDPPALTAAHAFFETTFRPKVKDDRDTWYCPRDRPDENQYENEIRILIRARLLREKNGNLALGEQADLVMAGLKTSKDLLREWWRAEQAGPQRSLHHSTQHNYNAPVGAVASGTNAVAHGTVNIGAVDASLHRLVDLQDQLGDLAQDLFALLLRVRQLEKDGVALGTLKADVLELEVESFAKRVKPEMHEHIAEVLKCVPALAQVILGTIGI